MVIQGKRQLRKWEVREESWVCHPAVDKREGRKMGQWRREREGEDAYGGRRGRPRIERRPVLTMGSAAGIARKYSFLCTGASGSCDRFTEF
uniref:Uncharacterized protein n=1 Tax=Setaria digitata TaxID=48799 RepID=A0A915Q1L5_9BILA